MKRIAAFVMAMLMMLSFAGMAETELIVFAAASLTETLTQLGGLYMQQHPETVILFNFDSSGTLKTQIQEGAPCDVFISAGQKQMNQLDVNAGPAVNADALDFVLPGTRFDILENEVALVVPEGNPAKIDSFEDLFAKLKEEKILFAMGNGDVPVGQYTREIFAYFGLSEEELVSSGCVSYGSNVKEVVTQVSEAMVDCGVVYRTDACSAGLTVVDTADVQMCGQAVYPAAIMNISENPDAARGFLAFLTDDAADAVFAEVGFVPLG